MVFREAESPGHKALPDLAVKVYILGVQPIDFEVNHERVARFSEAADGAFERVDVLVVFEDARVEAIGGPDTYDLGEAACVGGKDGTNVVLGGMKMVA